MIAGGLSSPLSQVRPVTPSKPSSRSFHSSSPPIAGADFCAGWPRRKRLSSPQQTWLCGIMRRDQDVKNSDFGEESEMQMLSAEDDAGTQILIQAQSLVEGSGPVLASEYKPVPEVDYLQVTIGFFGTGNMGFMHQELTEILSYAMKNHIYTSGESGTNAAVIRGALRAEKPELLTVILPQEFEKAADPGDHLPLDHLHFPRGSDQEGRETRTTSCGGAAEDRKLVREGMEE
ncbi:hypothetical protein ACJRO7_030625 [Eucalyptus globulus]|uniref:Uncharacterized protein n=1 Tax=Eucalyptus globulus TaxID=34317 RepID=A0ABD3JEQ2_EUCGL